jgi:hypothetical protein
VRLAPGWGRRPGTQLAAFAVCTNKRWPIQTLRELAGDLSGTTWTGLRVNRSASTSFFPLAVRRFVFRNTHNEIGHGADTLTHALGCTS